MYDLPLWLLLRYRELLFMNIIGYLCEVCILQSSTNRLTVNKIEGIFHILAAGMGAGIIIAVCEVLYNAKIDAIKSHGEVSYQVTRGEV